MDGIQLLSKREMAKILNVPTSWLDRKCMERGPDSIPRLKLGKYVRFEPEKVIEWIRQMNIMLNR